MYNLQEKIIYSLHKKIKKNRLIFLIDCSRYWMCNTDLSDCLCECPPMAPEGSLVFDYTIDYEHGGPVCNWPWAIECENKPNYCSKCEAWQEMTSFCTLNLDNSEYFIRIVPIVMKLDTRDLRNLNMLVIWC